MNEKRVATTNPRLFFLNTASVEYVDYMGFYDDGTFEKMIGVIDRFYSSPDNKFCNPASLAYLGYLEFKGEDITKLLKELQVYSEMGS